jgi:hypothetical protein
MALLSSLSINVAGQDSLTFTINRNVGTALGNFISGTFTLRGSGPTSIQNLTVYFNDQQVHFVTGNTIAWQFNTANYEGGTTNVTLIGITDTGDTFEATKTVVVLGGEISNLLTIGILAFVVIVLLAKYGPRLIQLRNK